MNHKKTHNGPGLCAPTGPKWLVFHRLLICASTAVLLASCGSNPPASHLAGDDAIGSPGAQMSNAESSGTWRHQEFPGKRANRYRYALKDGRHAVAVSASSSVSMLRKTLRIEPADLHRVRFSWKVPALIETADLNDRDLADSPVRVVLAFEGDRSRFSARDAMLSELAHALTGEPMPYATLMYVWDNRAAPGTSVTSKRTSRIRKMVMESGRLKLNQWLERRNMGKGRQDHHGQRAGTRVSASRKFHHRGQERKYPCLFHA